MLVKAMEDTLLLMKLFQRSFGESAARQQFEQFYARLEKADLVWVLGKIRCTIFPPNPGIEEGMPDFYYYYIPNSLWGTDKPVPNDPLGPGHTTRADGVGLNFGCPIRLHCALKILERIEPLFDGECSKNLRTFHKHLPTVEELLWGDAWNFGIPADRNAYSNSLKRPDWRIVDSTGDILLEAKFLPSDWVRFVDGSDHLPKECMRRAAEQLPTRRQRTTLNVVAFTGFGDMDRPLGDTFGNELLKYPHVDAVIYRAFRSDTWMFSLCEQPLARLKETLRFECMNDYQPFYPFSWVISEKEARAHARQKQPIVPTIPSGTQRTLVYEVIPITCAFHRLRYPPFIYKLTLLRREADGEPIFRTEAPKIF